MRQPLSILNNCVKLEVVSSFLKVKSKMKNKISLQEVERVAELAKIGLTEKEKEKFSEELSDILEYIEQLKEIDTKDIEPVSQVTGSVNVVREDVADDFNKDNQKIIIANFPEERDGYVKVKQVM